MRISDWSSDVCSTDLSAAKKSAPSVKATPADVNDRQHLIEVIQSGTGCTGVAARETMSALLNTITASLKKNQRVQLAGFGTFLVSKRAARKGVNPRTGEAIKIKASKRSEEHTSELQSLMRISYAVFCLKKKHTT